MYRLTPYITIDDKTFTSVHDVRVRKSIYAFADTATITIPSTALLTHQGSDFATSVQTAKMFAEGDMVSIRLGYNDELQTEFEGFVSRVNFASPCEIECEGYSWQLRKNTYTKTWDGNIKLKDILRYLIQGTDITIHKDTPDISFPFSRFVLDGVDGCQALKKLDDEAALTVYFAGRQLYVGLQLTAQTDKEVKYHLGWNTIKDNQLKYRREEDVKYRVSVQYKDKKGVPQVKYYGPKGGRELSPIKLDKVITDMAWLKQYVNKNVRTVHYEGYEGKINTFLQPYAQHGWKALVNDDKYPERSGAYIITDIDVSFGTSGARRLVALGRSLSKEQYELTEA